ncbi:MAG: type II secretion system protein GspC [Colwellia sp.]|nr:type II secretion system protein GspC [Colwellia sp.]
MPQQKIAQVISLCLLVYIASVAAKITWLIIPTNASQTISNNDVANVKRIQSQSRGQSQGKHVDLSKLQSLNLFGAYNESIVETIVVENVPETRLKLTLSGLVASDQAGTSAAIIEYKSKQETYGIGDIITGTRASLEQVLTDRVIIKQSGRLETLMLDGADYSQQAQSISNKKNNNNESHKALQPRQSQNSPQRLPSRSKPSVIDQRSNDNLSRNAQLLRADLNKDPGKIMDYLRVSPVRTGGKIVGYRLSPGKKSEFFKLSGLKSGDIAVQMNGYDLLAPLEAAQAMSALQTERDISLLVERKNELIEILFSID